MNETNNRDSIMRMARGAFEERVDYEMDKVIQNILDPNTKATAKRKITLTMELTPAFTDVIVKRYIRITGKQNVRCVRQGRELSREEIAGIFDPDEEGGGQE